MSSNLINKVSLKSKHNDREFIADFRYRNDGRAKPLVIFVHGLKGFKDWGHWNLISEKFANEGFVFLKLNLSHNGTTPEFPLDFADLEAFKLNNFSIELDDIGALLESIFSNESPLPTGESDLKKIFIIGHSRGGGLVLLKAKEDVRIKSVVTWAAVDDFGARWSESDLREWKSEGVRYMYNGRTKQNMPQGYQIVENYYQNQSRLNIKNAAESLVQDCLIVHGSNDETVKIDCAESLAKTIPSNHLHIIEGSNHVFGGKHPFNDTELPEHSRELVNVTISFLKEQSNKVV